MLIQVEYQEKGQCSLFHSCYDNDPTGVINIEEFVTDFSISKKGWIRKIRDCQNEKDQKTMKLRLPCITPAGVFSCRKSDCLLTPSGYLSLDFDNLDGITSTTKERLRGFPGLAYCGLSVRGNGLFCFIKIMNPENYSEHLAAVYQDLLKMGLKPDQACRDICRLRFVSYDPDPVINFGVAPYEKVLLPHPHQPSLILSSGHKGAIEERVKRCLESIEKNGVDITYDYRAWIAIAYSLGNEFGERGRDYFHRVSRYYSGYDPREADRTFTACLKGNNITISSFFYYCKINGIRW